MADTVTAGEKSSLGMDANLAAALSYVLGVITGLIFFLLEKQSRFVRFHALQAILFSVGWFVLSFVGGVLSWLGAFRSPLSQVRCATQGMVISLGPDLRRDSCGLPSPVLADGPGSSRRGCLALLRAEIAAFHPPTTFVVGGSSLWL